MTAPPRSWRAFLAPAIGVLVGTALFALAHPVGTPAGTALLLIVVAMAACIVVASAVEGFRPLTRKLVWFLAFAALAAPLLDDSYRTPLGPLAAGLGVLGMAASTVDIVLWTVRRRQGR